VIGIGVGVVYHWGGSVDISTGKNIKVPEPEFYGSALGGTVYIDPETGEELYMSVLNGIRNLSDGSLEDTVISSSADKKLHKFTLDATSNEDGLAVVSFPASSKIEAESLKHQVKVKVGGKDYGLEWFNDAYNADDAVNLGTNALLNYDEESGMAHVSVSFTDGVDFGKEIEISTPTSTDIELFAIERLVDFDSVQMNDNAGIDNDSVKIVGIQLEKLSALGSKSIVLTGVSYREGKTGVVVFENGEYKYYEHDKHSKGCHGTGDIYASAFVGAIVRGKSAFDAAKIAADYVLACIISTQEEDNHWYGAKFETSFSKLIEMLNS
jgi:hypothetical protein